AADDLNARAFTSGDDIYLGSGESASDAKLLAHESTHVAQQRSGAVSGGGLTVQKKEREPDAAPAAETPNVPGRGNAPALDFDEADMDRRLSSTAVPPAARDTGNVTVPPETHSSLNETKHTAAGLPVPNKGESAAQEGGDAAGTARAAKGAKPGKP